MILQQSYDLIDREAGAHGLPRHHYAVARRVVHATGDLDYLWLLEFREGFVEAAQAALRARCPVVVDSRMTLEGVRSHLGALGLEARCSLDAPGAAPAPGETYSEAAMRRALATHPDALVGVGTSPQALRVLCEEVRAGRARVRAVVGMPVGFVGVREAKRSLLELDVPSVVSLGRKGGSAAAAAVVNALVELVREEGGGDPQDPRPPEGEEQGVIHVIGVGASGLDALPANLRALVARAEVLGGGARQLALAEPWAYRVEETVLFRGDLEEATRRLDARRRAGKRVVVLGSGDPLFYGIGTVLVRSLPGEALVFHPGVSSVQLACARLRIPWQDVPVVSLHGRPRELLVPFLESGASPVVVLPGPTTGPREIGRLALGYGEYTVHVLENLGARDERIVSLDAEEAARGGEWAPLTLVVLTRRAARLPEGLPEESFVTLRDRPGMITKAEVRVLALWKLRVRPGHVVYDIGAGTGSVSVELGLLAPGARIFAVERRPEAAAVLRENLRRAGVGGVHVVLGEAPEALEDLPEADRVFVGGSGGRLREILEASTRKLKRPGIVVVTTATLESAGEAVRAFRDLGWDVDFLDVHLSRSAGSGGPLLRRPLGPVTIVRGIGR